MVIDLNKRKKDIRKFISAIEKSIINTLEELDMKSFNDRKNVGIWINHNKEIKKIAAIGIRVKKWIAFHGFSLNINVNKKNYNGIIPCGISDKGISNMTDFINLSRLENINEVIISEFKKTFRDMF